MKTTLRSIKKLVFRFLPMESRARINNLALVLLTSYERWRLYRGRDLPTSIDIETDWHCTRWCWYCRRPDHGVTMSEETFRKVIYDLKVWGFKGRISLHSYNEPLLDKRLCEFIKFAKDKLPYCPVVIYSNGDLLTSQVMDKLIAAGMDEVVVSIHEPTLQKKAAKLFQLAAKYPVLRLKDFRDGHRDFALTNRGKEDLAEKMGSIQHLYRCYQIYTMVIRSDSNVVLCCQDGLMEYVMGNVETQSLEEIWNSPRFKKIRKQVWRGKYVLPICKNCGFQAEF